MLRAAFAAVLDGGDRRRSRGARRLRALELLDALARLEEYERSSGSCRVVEQAVGDRAMAALTLGELFLARGFYRLAGDSALRAIEVGGPGRRGRSACSARAPSPRACSRTPLPVLEAALELDPEQASVAQLLSQVRERMAA